MPLPFAFTSDLSRKLHWHLALRALFVSILLGTTIAFRIYDHDSFLSSTLLVLYGLISLTYLQCVLSFLILRWWPQVDLVRFSALQIAWNLLFTTSVIFITGGAESIFTFMYLFDILNAAILLFKRGAQGCASGGAILFGTLAALHYYGVFDHLNIATASPFLDSIQVATTVATDVSMFFIIAYLAGHLAQSLVTTSAELRAAEADVRRLDRLNQAIVESLDDGLCIADSLGCIAACNPRLAAFAEEGIPLLGDLLARRLPFLGTELAVGHLAAVQAGEKARTWEQCVLWGAEVKTLEISAKRIPAVPGHDAQMMVLIHDLTAYRAMEEQVRVSGRLAAVGELAAGIAHEIRNPLASISGSVQLLAREVPLEGQDRRLMEIVQREIKRLDALIGDFLAFARPQQPHRKPLKLKDLIDTAAELFRQSEAEVTLQVEDRAPALSVLADERQLSQILWNLLKNAAEAMDHQGTIAVLCRRHGDFAELSVADNGPGIPSALREKIFDPFFTTKQRGTGLGLSIAYQIAEAHGGRLLAENLPEGGACLRLQLPLYLPDTSGASAQ